MGKRKEYAVLVKNCAYQPYDYWPDLPRSQRTGFIWLESDDLVRRLMKRKWGAIPILFKARQVRPRPGCLVVIRRCQISNHINQKNVWIWEIVT